MKQLCDIGATFARTRDRRAFLLAVAQQTPTPTPDERSAAGLPFG